MFRVRTSLTGGIGGPFLSQMYFQEGGGVTAQQAANATRTFWSDLAAWIVSGMAIQVESEVVQVSAATGLPTGTVLTTNAVVNSSAASAQSPAATQGLISWRTGQFVGAREVRGRTFIPGVPQSSLGAGIPGGAYVAALNTAAANLIASATVDLTIYSPTNHVEYDAVAGNAWTKFAVLRSRRD